MRAVWTLEACPRCDGSGWDYCQSCERCCEHDKLCGRCGGAERVPVKVEGWALVAAAFSGGTYYPTKRAALAAAEAPR